MPMRTPFTPALPTGILFWELATTVSGSSTTTRDGEFSLFTRGVTAWVELISICTPSAPGITFTRCNWLCAEAAGAGFAATGVDPGMAAGFTAGAGAPGAGLAVAGAAATFGAALSCFCCSDFAVLRALSMASGLCAQAPLTIIAVAKMPVVRFIAIPTSLQAFPV